MEIEKGILKGKIEAAGQGVKSGPAKITVNYRFVADYYADNESWDGEMGDEMGDNLSMGDSDIELLTDTKIYDCYLDENGKLYTFSEITGEKKYKVDVIINEKKIEDGITFILNGYFEISSDDTKKDLLIECLDLDLIVSKQGDLIITKDFQGDVIKNGKLQTDETDKFSGTVVLTEKDSKQVDGQTIKTFGISLNDCTYNNTVYLNYSSPQIVLRLDENGNIVDENGNITVITQVFDVTSSDNNNEGKIRVTISGNLENIQLDCFGILYGYGKLIGVLDFSNFSQAELKEIKVQLYQDGSEIGTENDVKQQIKDCNLYIIESDTDVKYGHFYAVYWAGTYKKWELTERVQQNDIKIEMQGNNITIVDGSFDVDLPNVYTNELPPRLKCEYNQSSGKWEIAQSKTENPKGVYAQVFDFNGESGVIYNKPFSSIDKIAKLKIKNIKPLYIEKVLEGENVNHELKLEFWLLDANDKGVLQFYHDYDFSGIISVGKNGLISHDEIVLSGILVEDKNYCIFGDITIGIDENTNQYKIKNCVLNYTQKKIKIDKTQEIGVSGYDFGNDGCCYCKFSGQGWQFLPIDLSYQFVLEFKENYDPIKISGVFEGVKVDDVNDKRKIKIDKNLSRYYVEEFTVYGIITIQLVSTGDNADVVVSVTNETNEEDELIINRGYKNLKFKDDKIEYKQFINFTSENGTNIKCNFKFDDANCSYDFSSGGDLGDLKLKINYLNIEINDETKELGSKEMTGRIVSRNGGLNDVLSLVINETIPPDDVTKTELRCTVCFVIVVYGTIDNLVVDYCNFSLKEKKYVNVGSGYEVKENLKNKSFQIQLDKTPDLDYFNPEPLICGSESFVKVTVEEIGDEKVGNATVNLQFDTLKYGDELLISKKQSFVYEIKNQVSYPTFFECVEVDLGISDFQLTDSENIDLKISNLKAIVWIKIDYNDQTDKVRVFLQKFTGQINLNMVCLDYDNDGTLNKIINPGILVNGNYLFYKQEHLTEFIGDLSNLTQGRFMFYRCTSLTSFSGDLKKLTDGDYMFSDCENLTSFNGKFSILQNGMNMFSHCENLTSFNGNLSTLKYGTSMFEYCTALTSFNSNLNTLDGGFCMFHNCTALTSFNGVLSSLTSGDEMFSGCTSLTSFTSDLSILNRGNGMFDKCKLDAQSVRNIVDTLPTRKSLPIEGSVGTITIGIGCNDIDKDDFATDCQCDNWQELLDYFSDKKWIPIFQFNGKPTT